MKALIYKDIKYRKKFLNQELNQKILTFVFRNLLNKESLSDAEKLLIYKSLQKKYSKIASKTKIVRRCSLTGRSRSSQRFVGVSRMKLKEMVSSNMLPGFQKSSW